jgi:hypothetical protein
VRGALGVESFAIVDLLIVVRRFRAIAGNSAGRLPRGHLDRGNAGAVFEVAIAARGCSDMDDDLVAIGGGAGGFVVVHVGTALAPKGHKAGDSHIEDGPHVTAVTSRRIACDSTIVPIKEDKNGEPLSIGRRSRTIPPPMRRALRVRDKGCRFPGCTNTRFVDGHHIEHWADGGETSLNNLVMLCRHHHHLVHEGGFVCEKSPSGDIDFKDQREQVLEPFPTMPGVAANDDVQNWIDREFFEANIDSDSSRQAGPRCTAKWHAGERMDWHAAVGSLFY